MKLHTLAFLLLGTLGLSAGCPAEATRTEAAEVLCPCLLLWFGEGDGSPCSEADIAKTETEFLESQSQECVDCIAESESCETLDEKCTVCDFK